MYICVSVILSVAGG